MLLNILLAGGLVTCLLAIGYLIVRKFPRLKTMDVETVPEAQADKVRDRLLLEKMSRGGKRLQSFSARLGERLFGGLKRRLTHVFARIESMEKKYQKEAAQKAGLSGGALEQKIRTCLKEANELLRAGKCEEAEKRLIEIISIAPAEVEAYRSLLEIYLAQKDYEQALPTAQFVLKLIMKRAKNKAVGQTATQEIIKSYGDIGDVCRAADKPAEALQNYLKALELEPNNPRHLDVALEMSIILKQEKLARELFARMKDVNPDNKKLSDYAEQITKSGRG